MSDTADRPASSEMADVISSTFQILAAFGLGILALLTALRVLGVESVAEFQPLPLRLLIIAGAALLLMWFSGRLLARGHPAGRWLAVGVLIGSPIFASVFFGSQVGLLNLIISGAIAA